jgi:hypothetical protein
MPLPDTSDRTRSVACFCHQGARRLQIVAIQRQQGPGPIYNPGGAVGPWPCDVDAAAPHH